MYWLKLGQTLWFFGKDKKRYPVQVIGVYKECFVARYRDEHDSKTKTFSYHILGRKIFTTEDVIRIESQQKTSLKSRCKDKPSRQNFVSSYPKRKITMNKSKALTERYIAIARNALKPEKPKAVEPPRLPVPGYVAERLEGLKKDNDTQRNCNFCALRKNGECSSLANRLCSDFRPVQSIPTSESENWPQYGDASANGMGNKKRYK